MLNFIAQFKFVWSCLGGDTDPSYKALCYVAKTTGIVGIVYLCMYMFMYVYKSCEAALLML